ncbi:hypothetical protein [Dietzia kunjamensis]|uniref:hypothetical protein n=1 Tax=Dietzia kunjamensis TaxID=322509 RepID=UPI003368BF2A
MSTKITADNGVELEVCHLGIDATNPNRTEPSSIWARLTAEQRTKLAAALAPERTPILEGRPVHGITVTGYVGDAPINPADCDRTTVYTGECRNFADTEWIRFDSGRRRSPDTSDGNTWLIDVAYGSFWMADDKVRSLVPLVPAPAGGQWTRDDLPSEGALADMIRDALDGGICEGKMLLPGHRPRAIIDLLVRWLNAHHPKPSRGVETGYALQVDALTRERDALDSQLTRVDMECAEAVTARVAAERTCDELRSLIQGQKEHVSKSIEVRNRMRRERDEALRKNGEAFDRAVRAERERDAAVARAEALEAEAEEAFEQGATWQKARTAPAVTHADVEKALDTGIRGTTDGGLIDQDTSIPSGECVRLAVDAMCDLLDTEAEQDVDPVEDQTDALADILYGHEMVTDQMRGVLKRVVRAGMLLPEQEADQ